MGTTTVDKGTFARNSAEYGGGIYNDAGLAVNTGYFKQNTAGSYGGGIYADGDMTLNNTTFSHNNGGQYGGGVYNEDAAIVTAPPSATTRPKTVAGG